LRSSLNQPLVAEIELLQVRDIGSEEIVPTLASPDEFNKAGVDRQYFLTDLKFTPIIKPNGKSVIRVTSSKPVREPYLNFLVEVLWPSGRLLREYTLLLDPPLYSSQTAMSAPQKPLVEQKAGSVTRAPAPSRPAPARPATSAPAAAKTPGEYRTTANDTLWEVAERVHTKGTPHQTMLAIQDLNPQAFLDGNINRLLSGQVLRLPDDKQVLRRTQAEALSEVAAQNAAWRARRAAPATAARQLDATHRSEAGTAPARVETGDNLRLVAAKDGKATAGSDKGADGKTLSDKLAVTKESLDSSQRENAELQSRMSDLQSQLDKLQRLIQLKDEQLAKLQANLADPAKAAEAPVAPAAVVASEAKPAAPVATPAVQPVAAAVATPAVASTEVKPEPAMQAESVSPAPAQPAPAAEPVAAPAPVAQPAPAAPPAPKPAPVKPVAVQPVRPPVAPQQPVGLIDSVLESPLLLPSLGGGAAIALLLGLLAARRRAARKAEFEDDELPVSKEEGRLDIGLSRTAVEPALLNDVSAAVESRDALSEADAHVASGRLADAAEVLEAACRKEPARSDLRLKLMEVRAELGDREGFARHEQMLRDNVAVQPQVDRLKMMYPGMVAAAAVATAALAGGLLDAAEEEETGLPGLVQDLEIDSEVFASDVNLSLDDLEAELERDLQAGSHGAGLDLDDLALDETQQPAVSSSESLAEDFSFDLELSEEIATLDQQAAPQEQLQEEGFALDLDMPLEPAGSESQDFLGLDLEGLEPPVVLAEEAPAPEAVSLEEGLFESFELPELESDALPGGVVEPEPELAVETLEPEPPQAPLADKPEDEAEEAGFMAQLDELSLELDQLAADVGEADVEAQPVTHSLEEGEDFDFLADADEIATKLDLARAYIEMGDTEGARDILDEVLGEGSEAQQQEAREMSAQLA